MPIYNFLSIESEITAGFPVNSSVKAIKYRNFMQGKKVQAEKLNLNLF